MSYLSMENIAGFDKAVISFWFRVPQESLDKANATSGDDTPLAGIVPLVVMGQEGHGDSETNTEIDDHVLTFTGSSGTNYQGGLVNIDAECTGTIGPFCCTTSLITFTYECVGTPFTSSPIYNGHTRKTTITGPGKPTNPTVIGVNSDGTLYVNFESNKTPAVSNWVFEPSSITPGQGATGVISGGCIDGQKAFGCDVLCCVCLIIECSNDVDNGHGFDNTTPSPPQSPGTGGTAPQTITTEVPGQLDRTGSIKSSIINVTPDQWHHVLISVDLTGSIASHGTIGEFVPPVGNYVDSAVKLWIALDDKNYIKNELSENWTGNGDNDVITDSAYLVAGTSQNDNTLPIPTYSLDNPSVPSGTMGMPAHSKYVDNIFKAEMAEFMMWTGVTLDTGIETNRRLFITAPGKTGVQRPVNPTPIMIPVAKTAAGDPPTWETGADTPAYAPPAGVFDLTTVGSVNKVLGKPAVDLTKASLNWMLGRNLGSLKGKFVKTGKIKAYFPDPNLGGPQGS